MYATTFPCHHCARHIVAAGIDKVVYIEPYSKSLAFELHHDAISPMLNNKPTHVVFLQYEGVAPKNMIRLFKHGSPRKSEGTLLSSDPTKAFPCSPRLLMV